MRGARRHASQGAVEDEESHTSDTHGRAEGARPAARSLHKWLRNNKTGHPRNPVGHLIVLPFLPAEHNPVQQTREKRKENNEEKASIPSIPALLMHMHGITLVVGRGNAEVGKENSKGGERPSVEASSIGRGKPIEAPSKGGVPIRASQRGRTGACGDLGGHNLGGRKARHQLSHVVGE